MKEMIGDTCVDDKGHVNFQNRGCLQSTHRDRTRKVESRLSVDAASSRHPAA
jgi:hypothetical protein